MVDFGRGVLDYAEEFLKEVLAIVCPLAGCVSLYKECEYDFLVDT